MSQFYGIHHDKPVLDFTNHLMGCKGCRARNGVYCEVGKTLHMASKPSVDVKVVRKFKQGVPDVRRELYTHLMTCHTCQPEHHQFCDDVFGLEGKYNDWLNSTDFEGRTITDVKTEFVELVIAGRIKKWKAQNEFKAVLNAHGN